MTVTEQGFAMLAEIRKEIGLDKEIETAEESPGPRRWKTHRNQRPDYVPWVKKRKPSKESMLAKPGEIRLYDFYRSEAKRLGLAVSTIAGMRSAGHYDNSISIRRVGHTMSFATVIGELPNKPQSEPQEVRLKEWLITKSRELGLTPNGVFMRMKRGAITPTRIRKVGRYTVFVIP